MLRVLIGFFVLLACAAGVIFIIGPGVVPEPSAKLQISKTAAPQATATQATPADASSQPEVSAEPAGLAPGQAGAGQATAPVPPPSAQAVVAADGSVISDPALLETSGDGPLPVISTDGRTSFQVYAGRFDATDPRPRVVVVVGGLGLGDATTQAAIEKLPPAVTLAFTPYGSALQKWMETARSDGHEVLLEVPMEPFDYPDNDPGPNALMTGSAGVENSQRLLWILSRMSGYAGLVNVQGGKLLSSQDELAPFMDQVKSRGLLFLETGRGERSMAPDLARASGAAYVRATHQIDREPSRDAIERGLKELANVAREKRVAIGFANASPGAIDRIAAWSKTLEEEGIAIAPVTAVLLTNQQAAVPQ